GGDVEWHYRPPSKGIAEQRDFLLAQAKAPAVLFVDDDVVMEPWVAGRLLDVLREQGCGFVGAFPAGLSFRDDVRPEPQHVVLESIDPSAPEGRGAGLHLAAKEWHASRRVAQEAVKLY